MNSCCVQACQRVDIFSHCIITSTYCIHCAKILTQICAKSISHFRLNKVIRAKMSATAQAHRIVTGLFSAIVANSTRKKSVKATKCRNSGGSKKTKSLCAVILMVLLAMWWATPELLAGNNCSGRLPEQHVDRMRIMQSLQTTPAMTMSHLDNECAYIGSRLEGSQLVRLLAKAYSAGSKVTVVDTFTNLGAMLDMVGLDLERQGQGQLATCSCGFKEVSLSIKLNGSGVPDVASKDLPGIKGAEVEEKVIAGFVADEHTLYTGITEYGQIVQVCLSAVLSTESTFHVLTQVTPGSVRLVCPSLKELVDSCTSPGGKLVSNSSQLFAASGSIFFYMETQVVWSS